MKTGLFGAKGTFVPLGEADHAVMASGPVREGARQGRAEHRSRRRSSRSAEERALYEHYGWYDRVAAPAAARPTGTAASSEPRRQGTVGHDTSGPTTDDAMTRSEEELRVGTTERETGRVRLKKYVVETTSPRPCRCAARRSASSASRSPTPTATTPSTARDISEEEHEVTLRAEEPVVEKRAVPKERVRLEKDVETDERRSPRRCARSTSRSTARRTAAAASPIAGGRVRRRSGRRTRPRYVTRPGRRVEQPVLAALDERAQAVERVPDVGEARVERRDAEPDRVGPAEVGHRRRRARSARGMIGHASRVAQRDVRAAARRVARRAEREAERRQPGVVRARRSARSARRTSRAARRCRPRRSAARPPRPPRARGSAACRPGSARSRRPGRSRAPSRTGRAGRTSPRSASAATPGSSSRDVEERGRARPGVEVLVGAADRQLARPPPRRSTGTAPAECERSQTTSRRARGGGRQRGHVGERARAVVDVREHDERGRRGSRDGGPSGVVEQPQLAPARRGEPLEHVAVGREVAAVGDDRAAPRVSSAAGASL